MTKPSRARQSVQRFKTTHTPRPPRTPTPSQILWNTDPTHKQERLSWRGKEVSKFFPTHGTFKGKVHQYHYASDHYTITYEDNDVERVPYVNMKRIVPGTPEYIEHQSIVKALHVAFIAAATEASATTNNDTTPTKKLVHPSKSQAGNKPWTRRWRIFATLAAGYSFLGALYLQILQSWTLAGRIARSTMKIETSLSIVLDLSPKDSLKSSVLTTLNLSHQWPLSSLFGRVRARFSCNYSTMVKTTLSHVQIVTK